MKRPSVEGEHGTSWSARITNPRTGKRKRYMLGPRTGPYRLSKSEAEQVLTRKLARVLEPASEGLKLPLGSFLDRWLPVHSARVTRVSHVNMASIVRGAADHFGQLPMSAVDVPAAEEYAVELLADRMPSTVRQMVAMLTAAWNAALERNVVTANPWPIMRRRLPRVEERVVYMLSETERKALLNKIPEELNKRAFVALIDEMGLRRSEAEHICWNDYRRPRLTIRRTKTRKARTIRLTAPAIEVIETMRRKSARKLIGVDRIFGITADPVANAFRKAVRDLGLPIHGLHDLRHNVATRAAMGGARDYQIAKLLGNTPAVCLRYMDHAPQVGADLAVDALERISQEHEQRAPQDHP